MNSLEKAGSAKLQRLQGKTRTALLVAGMHRSGTSAATRVLNLMGCDIVRDPIQADVFNERGYWEAAEIASLNDALLASAGLSWDSWESLGVAWHRSNKPAQFLEDGMALVERQFGRSAFFALKDPRICRLLPFWQEVLETLGIAVKVVIPVRKPREVAASLLRRNHTNPALAQLVWLRYVLDAEFHSRDLPRAFFSYDSLLDDWRQVLASISHDLGGIAWPRQSAKVLMEVDMFLSAELRHHNTANANAFDFSPWVREVWRIMKRWSANPVEESDFSILDYIRNSFDEAEQSFARPLVEHQQHGIMLNGLLADANVRLDTYTQIETERACLREDLQSAVAGKERLRVENAALRAGCEDLEARLAVVQADSAAQLAALGRSDERLREAERAAADRTQETAALHADIADAREQLRIEREAAQTEKLDAERRASELEVINLARDDLSKALRDLGAEMAVVQADSAAQLAALGRSDERLREAERAAADRTQETAALHADLADAREQLRIEREAAQTERLDAERRASELEVISLARDDLSKALRDLGAEMAVMRYDVLNRARELADLTELAAGREPAREPVPGRIPARGEITATVMHPLQGEQGAYSEHPPARFDDVDSAREEMRRLIATYEQILLVLRKANVSHIAKQEQADAIIERGNIIIGSIKNDVINYRDQVDKMSTIRKNDAVIVYELSKSLRYQKHEYSRLKTVNALIWKRLSATT